MMLNISPPRSQRNAEGVGVFIHFFLISAISAVSAVSSVVTRVLGKNGILFREVSFEIGI